MTRQGTEETRDKNGTELLYNKIKDMNKRRTRENYYNMVIIYSLFSAIILVIYR